MSARVLVLLAAFLLIFATSIFTPAMCIIQNDPLSFESRSLDYLFQEKHRSEPVFDESTTKNVTTASGKTVYLPCRIRNLGDRTVSVSSPSIETPRMTRTRPTPEKMDEQMSHVYSSPFVESNAHI